MQTLLPQDGVLCRAFATVIQLWFIKKNSKMGKAGERLLILWDYQNMTSFTREKNSQQAAYADAAAGERKVLRRRVIKLITLKPDIVNPRGTSLISATQREAIRDNHFVNILEIYVVQNNMCCFKRNKILISTFSLNFS